MEAKIIVRIGENHQNFINYVAEKFQVKTSVIVRAALDLLQGAYEEKLLVDKIEKVSLTTQVKIAHLEDEINQLQEKINALQREKEILIA
jgi:TolA-binding protein